MNTLDKTRFALSAVTFAAFGLAASVRADTVNDAKSQIEQKLFEITGKDTAVLSFNKGSSELSSSEAATLKATVNAVREGAPVKEILVIAYADVDYPHNAADDLSAPSQKLAEARADAVKARLSELGADHVKTYDMAKKASWFDKTFATSSAEVKREAAPSSADADDAFYQALGQRLRREGGPSKVVVVVRHEGNYAH